MLDDWTKSKFISLFNRWTQETTDQSKIDVWLGRPKDENKEQSVNTLKTMKTLFSAYIC